MAVWIPDQVRDDGAGGREPLPRQRRGDILCFIDADHRRLRREGAHFGDEGGGGGNRKMGAHRGDIRPFLDKDEATVDRLSRAKSRDMAAMPQTPRLAARPRAMPGAERDHALAMLEGQDEVAGDEDHDDVIEISNIQMNYRMQLLLGSHNDEIAMPPQVKRVFRLDERMRAANQAIDRNILLYPPRSF